MKKKRTKKNKQSLIVLLDIIKCINTCITKVSEGMDRDKRREIILEEIMAKKSQI